MFSPRLIPLIILPALLLSAGVASGAPADSDRGFGANGRAVIDFGGDDDVYAMAVQPDGKTIVAGSTSIKYDAAVARVNSDGSPDRGFGGDGVVLLESAGTETIQAVAVQPDGKLLLAGHTSDGSNGVVYRLNSDGLPDKGFGTDGVAVLDSAGDEYAEDLAIQPDGRIVVAGSTSTGKDAAIYRLTAAGKPDNSFDNDGAVGINALGQDWAYGVEVQADGKIVIAGASRGSGQSKPLLARLNENGSPDASIGSGGWKTLAHDGYFFALALQPDGKIVAAGETFVDEDAVVARFNGNGAPDKGFGDDGEVALDLGDNEEALALALQPDGRIVVGGKTDGGDDAAVWRLTDRGARDGSFGNDGELVVSGHGLEEAVGIGVQPDGKIVLAGQKAGYYEDALVYRLLGDSRVEQPAQPGGGPGDPPAAATRCAGKRATIVGTARRDVLRGTRRRDVIAALGGNDVIRGLAGDDIVCAGGGNDVVDGGAGRDRLLGGAGRDRLLGGPGRDRLIGGPGRDRQRG
jgi:uncharacterized delta-60 repeat protein